MSLTISEIIGLNFKGNYERYIKINFRGIQRELHSNVYNDSTIFASSIWDLSSVVTENDCIEISLYNKNKIFNDRFLGSLRYEIKNIKKLQDGGVVVKDNIIDDNGNQLKIKLNFALKYIPPLIKDTDVSLHLSSTNNISDVSSFNNATSSQLNLLDYQDGVYKSEESLISDISTTNPKIRLPEISPILPEFWQIHVHIYQGKHLTGQSIDPVVDIEIDDKKESTNIQRQTNDPVWDDTFVFEFTKSKERMLNTIFYLKVYTGRNVATKGNLIGHSEFDLWTIYNEPLHRSVLKWVVLQENESSQIQGYILITISVISQGNELYLEAMTPPILDATNEHMDLLLPKNSHAPREIYKYDVTIFKAESISAPTTSAFGSVKKALGGKHVELADTYVQVNFGTQTLRTKVIKGTSNPIFNETLTFKDFYPSMFQHLKVQLRDKDASSDECLATHFINTNDITYAQYDGDDDKSSNASFTDGEYDTGLVPTFGPSWIYFYGSTRDFEKWAYMNEGYAEGDSFRGKLLVSINCSSVNTVDSVREVKNIQNCSDPYLGPQETFFLYATIYDATMIDRSQTEKQILFEVTIGACGHESADHGLQKVTSTNSASNTPKSQGRQKLATTDSASNKSQRRSSLGSTESLLQTSLKNERKQHFSVSQLDALAQCGPYQSQILPCRRFCHIDFGPDKPCMYLQFRQENVSFRAHHLNMLRKSIFILEDNLLDITAHWKYTNDAESKKMNRLHEIMNIFSLNCDDYLKQVEIWEENCKYAVTTLDRNIIGYQVEIIKSLKKKIKKIFREVEDGNKEDFVLLLQECKLIQKKIRSLLTNPYHAFPDIIIWMICGGVRIAYARVSTAEVLYSKVDLLCGEKCGILQTVFLRSPCYRSTDRYQSLIQAKLQVRFWFGLEKDKSNFLINAPKGYTLPVEYIKFPTYLKYDTVQKYILRVHMYQGRTVLGSDVSGLSDPFARILFGHSVEETRIISQTRTAVWNQMIKFKGVALYGNQDDVISNPPVVVVDIFDKDEHNTEEFLGRCTATPNLVKSGFYMPPKLEWLPIMIGNDHVGEVLAAFELFPSSAKNLPLDPPIKMRDGQSYYQIPDDIKPRMEQYRVEVLLWGVREMKRFNALKVMHPQIIADINYDIRLLSDGKKHKRFRSKICTNALTNPNFHDALHIFDVELPAEKLYMPTFTFKVYEHRRFGRTGLVGTHTSEELTKFMQRPDQFKKLSYENRKYSTDNVDNENSVINPNDDVMFRKQKYIKKKPLKSNKRQRDYYRVSGTSDETDILDWWSRFYISLYDLMDEKGYKREQTEDEKAIPRITIYDHELEKEFNNFNDFLQSFTIYRGKQFLNQDRVFDKQREKGKIKGAIRIWKRSTIAHVENVFHDPNGTFHNLPSKEPIKILVRVYCIMAKQLVPKDYSGKADPFFVVKLGDKKISDSDNHASNTLDPEFGRLFEFEGILPFDNLLTIQIFDWDLLPGGNDLIGETQIDVEDRFYSKHRATCGISKIYKKVGYAAWRDGIKPTTILNELCARDGLSRPNYDNYDLAIEGVNLPKKKDEQLLIDIEEPKYRDNETKALGALHSYENISPGCKLVPEHVETRSLYHPDKPGLPQGKLMLWIDIFPTEHVTVMPPVDISRRKPKEYELRVIIWNVEKVPLLENSFMLGTATSDIYVRGWLEGSFEDQQKTDVHYRSSDGTGMFNWRFLFPFNYHQAKKQFVYSKKLTTFSLEETELFFPPILNLQCMESDVVTSDDVIGDLKIPLQKISPYFARSSGWSIKDFLRQAEKSRDRPSLFKCRSVKGWWPFLKGDDLEQGRVELEIELVTKEESELNPVGLRREEPQALEKPSRPEESMRLILKPLKTFRLLFGGYKLILLKILVVTLLFMIVFLFIYALPGYIAKKTLSV